MSRVLPTRRYSLRPGTLSLTLTPTAARDLLLALNVARIRATDTLNSTDANAAEAARAYLDRTAGTVDLLENHNYRSY